MKQGYIDALTRKPCEYCSATVADDAKNVVTGKVGDLFGYPIYANTYIVGDEMRTEISVAKMGGETTWRFINFCPMCGRAL